MEENFRFVRYAHRLLPIREVLGASRPTHSIWPTQPHKQKRGGPRLIGQRAAKGSHLAGALLRPETLQSTPYFRPWTPMDPSARPRCTFGHPFGIDIRATCQHTGPMASTRRFTKPPFRGQKGRCAWCGTTDLPKGRKSWCSQRCVNQYRMVADPSHIRFLVRQRDHGICALCGCDADAEYHKWIESKLEIERLASWLIHHHRFNLRWDRGRWVFAERDPEDYRLQWDFRKYLRAKYLTGAWTPRRTSGWDADHIIPVCEGGGECDLSNYRTLCHPCHKRVTAELATRRAAKGRPKGRTLVEIFVDEPAHSQ